MAKLTDIEVKNKPTGRYYDGNGLILRVRKSGSRDWALRITIDGKTSDYGLGGYDNGNGITLAEARKKAKEKRISLKNGEPHERNLRVKSKTFKEVAEEYISIQEVGWRNHKSAKQWRSTLEAHVYPKIGAKFVKSINKDDVKNILNPIWNGTKTREGTPETASRIRGRIERIMEYAEALDLFEGKNPARWEGNLKPLFSKKKSNTKVKHHNALDYRDLPDFWKELSKMEGNGAAALRWTILTAARSGETRGASYDELDRDDVWIIPDNRMKAEKEHRVPLTKEALATIPPRQSKNNKILFPAARGGVMSDMTLSAVLRRMGRKDITVHGFRSTFRDWAGETTAHPREVIEHALAHQLKDKAEAAYARSDLLAKRRKLMEDWAKFVTGEVK